MQKAFKVEVVISLKGFPSQKATIPVLAEDFNDAANKVKVALRQLTDTETRITLVGSWA